MEKSKIHVSCVYLREAVAQSCHVVRERECAFLIIFGEIDGGKYVICGRIGGRIRCEIGIGMKGCDCDDGYYQPAHDLFGKFNLIYMKLGNETTTTLKLYQNRSPTDIFPNDSGFISLFTILILSQDTIKDHKKRRTMSKERTIYTSPAPLPVGKYL